MAQRHRALLMLALVATACTLPAEETGQRRSASEEQRVQDLRARKIELRREQLRVERELADAELQSYIDGVASELAQAQAEEGKAGRAALLAKRLDVLKRKLAAGSTLDGLQEKMEEAWERSDETSAKTIEAQKAALELELEIAWAEVDLEEARAQVAELETRLAELRAEAAKASAAR